MSYPINDEEMLKEITTDLVNTFGFTEERAKEIASNNASYIVNRMWDEYSEALSYAIGKYGE